MPSNNPHLPRTRMPTGGTPNGPTPPNDKFWTVAFIASVVLLFFVIIGGAFDFAVMKKIYAVGLLVVGAATLFTAGLIFSGAEIKAPEGKAMWFVPARKRGLLKLQPEHMGMIRNLFGGYKTTDTLLVKFGDWRVVWPWDFITRVYDLSPFAVQTETEVVTGDERFIAVFNHRLTPKSAGVRDLQLLERNLASQPGWLETVKQELQSATAPFLRGRSFEEVNLGGGRLACLIGQSLANPLGEIWGLTDSVALGNLRETARIEAREQGERVRQETAGRVDPIRDAVMGFLDHPAVGVVIERIARGNAGTPSTAPPAPPAPVNPAPAGPTPAGTPPTGPSTPGGQHGPSTGGGTGGTP